MTNFYKFSNLVLKMTSISGLSFYTTWGLFLFSLYITGILTKYQSSIFIILLHLFFGGMMITYIYPQKIVIPYIKRVLAGRILKLYNLVFHVLPLLLFVYMYNPRIKSDNLYLATVSLLIYVVLFNPLEVYNYKENNFRRVIANIMVIIYLFILSILIIKQKKVF
jgi:hypothetical protein